MTSVLVVTIHPGEVSGSYCSSLIQMMAYDLARYGPRLIAAGAPAMMCVSAGRLVEGRNDSVRFFLERTEGDWLLLIDSDMGFEHDALEQLLAAADPVERPVMGGLCFYQKLAGARPGGGMSFQIRPTIYDWHDPGDVFQVRMNYQRDAVTRCGATGAAFLLVHRNALQATEDWFTPITSPKGTTFSEDISFCVRLAAADIPVHVHTGVKTTHHKSIYLDEVAYDTQGGPVIDWPEFVVTGTGRCGTGYTAQLLGRFVSCGHEQIFGPTGIGPRNNLVGDSSWMAVPHLDDFDGIVFHQVRHPVDAIRSMVGIKMFSDAVHGPYRRFAFEHQPGLTGDDLTDAMTWWVEWNRRAAKHATLTYRVEDLPLKKILDLVGVSSTKAERHAALASMPSNVNHRERARLGWGDLPDGERKDEIRELAVSYGYDL